MNKFDETYEELMEMVAGGAFGDTGPGHGGDLMSTDWYAPGDARVPKVIGAKKKKKKKGKKGKKDSNDVEVPIMRRTFPAS